jgi:ribonuclease HII
VILPAHCFDDRTLLAEVTDSKLLSPPKRERLAADILRLALCATVAWVEAPVIDHLNILRATRLAMQAALACTSGPPSVASADGLWYALRVGGRGLPPDFALTDAVPLLDVPLPQRAVIRGDRQCLSIAAASIVAKVTRDAEMRRRAAAFAPYDFASNKGYGSRRHMQALRNLGVTSEHRRSFAPVKYLLGIRDHVAGRLPKPEQS